MRFLHVLAERGFSGGEVQLKHLVEYLHARGHENAFVLAPGAQFAAVATGIGAPITWVNLRRPLWPGTRWRLLAAVRDAGPDVLHFGCGRSLLWGGWWLRHCGVPLRITTRRIDYPIRKSWWHGGRYRALVDHTVANCKSVQRAVLASGVPSDRVSLVHEGIDTSAWDLLPDREGARERLGLSQDATVISCAATLRPRKGQRLLIRAFCKVAAEFDNAFLVLAGEGPDRDTLGKAAHDSGFGARIFLPGAVRPVADLYAASDLFCMTSFNEGLSNACLEASAAGLPLVVSDVGGLPEIVEHGVTGAVVAPGDVDGLAEALIGYLGDSDQRYAMGCAGAQRVRRLFQHTKMSEKMEELFETLLASCDVRSNQD